MIDNEHIKSIGRLENGRFMLTVEKKSIIKLSLFALEDDIEFNDILYKSEGKLELFNIKSVKIFLDVNKRHLSEELRTSILRDAEGTLPVERVLKTSLAKMSLFQQTEQRIPLARLEVVKIWVDQFLNLKHMNDFLPTLFSDIFIILIPYEKREKVPGSPLYKAMEQNGEILIHPLQEQIGLAYKKYHDFMAACITLKSWSHNLGKIAKEPENLGRNWTLLEEGNEDFLKSLIDWLQAILSKGQNPIDATELKQSEIERLNVKCEVLLRAYEMLKPAQQSLADLPQGFA